jgi:murein L,D-transpeptidase YafK
MLGSTTTRIRAALLASALAVLSPALIDAVAAAPRDTYEIQVIKSKRLLLIKHGSKVEKEFRVASGKGGKGDKRKLGDRKTPVGIYRIVELKDSEKFHRFLRLSYPNVKDAIYGLRNKMITRAEFDAIVAAARSGVIPPQDTPLGGAIGIHGLGDESGDRLYLHLGTDWTEGCIALTNEQVEEVMKYVDVGTKVVISE